MITAKTYRTAERIGFDVVANAVHVAKTARATKRARKLAMKNRQRSVIAHNRRTQGAAA